MQKTFYFLASLILLTTNLNSTVNPTDEQPLTLSELIEIALKNNPATRQSWWNAERAASSVEIAKSSYYPQIGIDAIANHGRDFKYINGPDTTYTILGVDIYLKMLLYDYGGREASVQAASKALIAAGWQTNTAFQKVMVDVLENAYATLHAKEVSIAAWVSLQEAEKVLNAAKELNRTGLSPISDVYTAQSNFYQMKMSLARHQAEFDIYKGKLARAIGLTAETAFDIAPISDMKLPDTESIHLLMDLAMKQRSELMSMQAKTSEAYSRQQAAKSAYGPKISLYGAGGANHAVHDKANGAQYKIAINLDMPLFTGFKTMYENRVAYTDTKLALNELSSLELDIALEVLTAARTLQASIEILPDAEENLKFALKAYESVLSKYKAGKERIADMSYAQQELAEARVRFSDVKTRFLVSLANLAYATGSLAPYTESSCNAKL